MTPLIPRGLIIPAMSRVPPSPHLTGDCPGGCQARSGQCWCRGAGSSFSAPAPSPACAAPSWPRRRGRRRCSCSAGASWWPRPPRGYCGLAARPQMDPVLPACWRVVIFTSILLPQITICPLTVATYSLSVTCVSDVHCAMSRGQLSSQSQHWAASAHCATLRHLPPATVVRIMGKHSSQVQIITTKSFYICSPQQHCVPGSSKSTSKALSALWSWGTKSNKWRVDCSGHSRCGGWPGDGQVSSYAVIINSDDCCD